MRPSLSPFLLWVAAVSMGSCSADRAPAEWTLDCPSGAASAPSRATPAPTKPQVVVISVDGLRPDAIGIAPARHIQALACRGSYSWSSQTIPTSLTLPAHGSMLTGYLPELHGLSDWNDFFRPERGYSQVPTVFSAAKATGLRTVMVVGKDKLRHLAIPDTVDEFIDAGVSDEAVAQQAMSAIERGFDIVFVHFPMVDLIGHFEGWMSKPYLAQVAATDRLLGDLLATLSEGTTVILTADHGGLGYHHQSGATADVTIPWIIAGPRLRRAYGLTVAPSILDTAATVARILGTRLPDDAAGRPVAEAFAD